MHVDKLGRLLSDKLGRLLSERTQKVAASAA
jgi:hypothetical protein